MYGCYENITKVGCTLTGTSHPLLSDTDATVSQLYGVNRETFLIDRDGIVRKVWPKVKPDDHASEVLEEVDALRL